MYESSQKREAERISRDNFDPEQDERDLKDYAVSLEPHELIRLTFVLIEQQRQRAEFQRSRPKAE